MRMEACAGQRRSMGRFVALTLALVALATGCRLTAGGGAGPEWVSRRAESAAQGRFVSAVGTAGPGANPAEMQKRADLRARELLADKMSKYVRRLMVGFLEAHRDYGDPSDPPVREFVSSLADEVAAEVLRAAVRQDTWRGPGGRAYALYQIPASTIERTAVERAGDMLARSNPFNAPLQTVSAELSRFVAWRASGLDRSVARPAPAVPPPSENRPPSWLALGRDQQHPPEQYMTAVGLGPTPEQAEQAARVQLAAQLNAALKSAIKALSQGEQGDPLRQNVAALRIEADAFDPGRLVATRVAQRWHDSRTDTHYVLLAFDRRTAMLVYRQQLEASAARTASLLASARNQQKADNYASSLADYLEAILAARRAVVCQLKALVAGGKASEAQVRGLLTEPILPGARAEAQALLADISIETVSGDSQWVPPGVPLPQPLSVRVSADGGTKPVEGLPLRLVASGTGRFQPVPALSAMDGTAEWRLTVPPPPDDGTGSLVAEVDLERVLSGAAGLGLRVPRARFSFVLRSRANTYVALHLRERTPDGTLLPTSSASDIEAALKAEGFRIVEDPALRKLFPDAGIGVDSSEADVLKAFAALRRGLGPGKFLLIAIGEMQKQMGPSVATSQGQLQIVYHRFRIKVFDPDLPGEQKAVASIEGTGKGAYTDDVAEAARRARQDATAAASALLLSELRQRLAAAGG